MPRPFRSPQALLLLSGLALAIALMVAGVLAVRQDPSEVQALKTRGSLVGVTVGSQPLRLGAPWQKLLLTGFPQLQERIGGALVPPPPSVDPGSLVVWRSLGDPGFWDGAEPGGDITLEGPGQARMATRGSVDGVVMKPVALVSAVVKQFPRRGSWVRFRLDQEQGGRSEMVVPNPTPGPHPVWRPDAPGVVRRHGPLETSLRRIQVGPVAGGAPENRSGLLELHIRERGQPAASRWGVERVTLSDPTGNTWELRPELIGQDKLRLRIRLCDLGVLPLAEPAYRVRVTLARTGTYPAEDRWTIRDLHLPRPRQVVRTAHRRSIHGCEFTLSHLMGPDADAGTGWTNADYPRMLIQKRGRLEGFKLRAFTGESPHAEECAITREGEQSLILTATPPRRRCSLTLSLTPQRTVEFLAHLSPGPPASPRPSEASP